MNILTIDIEDWFHILDNPSTKGEIEWSNFESRLEMNLERIFQLLAKDKIKATFFCLGWIAEKYPQIIRKIANAGYEIGCHSYMHQLVYEQSRNEFKNDLVRALHLLEDLSGRKINVYRAPGFSFTEKTKWAFEVLAECGITTDSSIFAANRGHGGYPEININEPAIIEYNGIKIKEFPISYYSVIGKKILFSGGGYFRLFPYSLIKQYTNKSKYVMTYIHPRDFDPGQPMIKDLQLIRKFKSYYGLKSAFSKFEKWLTDFEFIDIKTANDSLEWEKVPLIIL
ncbi:MAG: polysaccharide deacetylase family protein [Bacteroidota bacterium]